MTIQTKSILITGICLLAFVAGSFATTAYVLLARQKSRESDHIVVVAEDLRDAFDSEIRTLVDATKTWAAWEETYRFLEGKNEPFPNRFVVISDAVNSDVNVMAVLEWAEDSPAMLIAVDPSRREIVDPPTGLPGLFQSHPDITRHEDAYSCRTGIVTLDGRPMLFVCAPIIQEDFLGQIPGSVFFGRWVDESVAKSLAKRIETPVEVAEWSRVREDESAQVAVRSMLSGENGVGEITSSADIARACVLLRDIDDQPIVVLEALVERAGMNEAWSGVYVLGAVFLFTGLGCALVVGVVNERLILRRLSGLAQDVGRVRFAESDDMPTLQVSGNDELSSLARSANEMLSRLSKSYADVLAANKAKTQFLASVSHELRTPLTAILGFAELVEDGDDAIERHEAVSAIRKNGSHLLTLINDLLDFAKVESRNVILESRKVSLRETLKDVEKVARVKAAERGLSLDVQIKNPLPTTIVTDPTRLMQVLLNLVGNAVKFTQRGGVRVTVEFLDESLKFEVIDSGIGIPKDRLTVIFDPFIQADSSITRQYGGTGLGLAIAKRLIELLGGEIEVVSSPGRGTTMAFTIAVGDVSNVERFEEIASDGEGSKADVAPTSSPRSLEGVRVLIAEDGVDNQRFLSAVLRSAGAETALVENGEQAVDEALDAETRGEPFQVILMDMQMPVMDGYTATRRIREAGLRIPVLALTAHAMKSDRDKCLEAGCSDYATKPIGRKDLVAGVSRLLETRATTGP